jgi:hypothetical protein
MVPARLIAVAIQPVGLVAPNRNFAYRQLSLQHFSIAELAAAKVLRFSALAWEGKARAVRIADDRKARSTYQSIVLRAS